MRCWRVTARRAARERLGRRRRRLGGGRRGQADAAWRRGEAGGDPVRGPCGGWRRMAGPSLLRAAPPPAEGQRALFPPLESPRVAAQAVP